MLINNTSDVRSFTQHLKCEEEYTKLESIFIHGQKETFIYERLYLPATHPFTFNHYYLSSTFRVILPVGALIQGD